MLLNLIKLAFCNAPCAVGGQAVLEGIMMRAGDTLAVAVRLPDGRIGVKSSPWFSLTRLAVLKKPFVRGFPILIETMINGIKSLNFSARQAGLGGDGEEVKSWHLFVTMMISIAAALGLFVVVPHIFSLIMEFFGLAGDLDSISFHAWDGLFKFAIFIGYILAISFMPDIRRVFQYHGAEHMVIWAYEKGEDMDAGSAKKMSRLHPRCGTTFLLFVLSLAIIINAFSVPLFLKIIGPQTTVLRHASALAFKLCLMMPISALAYELIKASSKIRDPFFGMILKAPGLFLQLLTTRRPDEAQLEVALVALKEALATTGDDTVIDTPDYTVLEVADAS